MKNLADGAAALIERAGQSITYRAISTGTFSNTTRKLTATETDYSIRAGVREYSPREITGLVNFGDRKVIMRASDLPFTPKEGDKVKVGSQWFRIAAINTRNAGDNSGVHIMQVTGK